MSNNNKRKHPHQPKAVGPDGRIIVVPTENNLEPTEETVEEEIEEVVTPTEEEEQTYSEMLEENSVDTGVNIDDLMDKYVEERAPKHAEKATPPTYEHMYRVRLEWERPDTQIFASPDFETAKAEALKHDGYKVYVDDDGVLESDPWFELRNAPKEEAEKDIPVRHPIPGKGIDLVDEWIYRTGSDHVPFMKITGTVYYYDNEIVNGKAKVTAVYHDFTKEAKNPNLILGYIKV